MDKLDINDNLEDYEIISEEHNLARKISNKVEELKLALREMEISDEKELDSEIERLTNEIEKIKTSKPKKANELGVELGKCRKIKSLFEEIKKENPATTTHEQLPNIINKVPLENEGEKYYSLEELREDYLSMPTMCPERIAMELIEYVKIKELPEKYASGKQIEQFEFVRKLDDLESALMKQDMLKDKMRFKIQDIKDLYNTNTEFSSIGRQLKLLLLEIMPVNIREIQRLMKRTQTEAKTIKDRDIILFVGETGCGKSTTIRFLSGCSMINTMIEITPGKFMPHIEPDQNSQNLCNKNIIASPESKSTTRYIAAQIVPLDRIFGPCRNGFITLCDAPGFGDTTGTEVEVANCIGVLKAIAECKSVKIVAMSSYKGLGDRGQGIVKLANILENMIDDITDRLTSVIYVFTKYPEDDRNVNAMLTNIHNIAYQDKLLEANEAFMSILKDMINKTEKNVKDDL